MRKEVSKEGIELNWPSGKRSLITAASSNATNQRLYSPTDKARHLLLKAPEGKGSPAPHGSRLC